MSTAKYRTHYNPYLDAEELEHGAEDVGIREADLSVSQRVALSGREKLSSVLYLKDGSAIFCSWSNGHIRVGSEKGAVRRFLQKTAMLHLTLSGETLVVGTWGAILKLLPLDAVLK